MENNRILNNINDWKSKLLDLGKRNNLINFKETKSSTLELIQPSFFDVYSKISSYSNIEIFDENIKEEEDIFEEEKNNPAISKEEFLNKYYKKIKQSQFVFFNKYAYSKAVLKKLKQKANEAINERGINILYLAFGILEWEDLNNKTNLKAPLLLMPVALESESINKPFKIRSEDEIQINVNIQYYFKHNYGIELEDFDEENNINEFFDKVRQKLSGINVKINENIFLSTFSFNKLNMYVDIDENEEDVIDNPIIKALSGQVDETSDCFLSSEEINKINNSKDLFFNQNNVVDADFSQSQAIQYALTGKSFVLQGPPGTGKSQTITNIIAELINSGKKVLFVSEKLAALEVVYNNLKKVKLDDFCLRLHSNKANKKDVVKNLADTLNLNHIKLNDEVNNKRNILENKINNLNLYETELYKINKPINLSAHDIISRATKLSSYKTLLCPIDHIENKTLKHLENDQENLKSYVDSFKKLAYFPNVHPFYGLYFHDNNLNSVFEFSNFISNFKLDLYEYLNCITLIKNKYNLEINNEEDFKIAIKFLNFCSEKNIDRDEILLNDSNNNFTEIINIIIKKKEVISNQNTQILKYFSKDIFDADINEYLDVFKEAGRSVILRLFKKEYMENRKKLLNYIKASFPGYNRSIKYLEKVKSYHEELKELNNTISEFNSYFKQSNFDINSNWFEIKETFINLDKILNKYKHLKNCYISNFDKEDLLKFEKAYDSFINNIKFFEKYINKSDINLNVLSHFDLYTKVDNIYKNLDEYNHWYNYIECKNTIDKDKNLSYFVKTCQSEEIDPNEYHIYYEKLFFSHYMTYLFNKNRNLELYDRFKHTRDIEEFKKEDNDGLDISKVLIRKNILSNFPDPNLVVSAEPVNILKREANKIRKIKPIRVLFNEIPELIQTLKPCFLMSPLSVSTYLNKNIKFDTVIFDEASQVFPEDAIVAIYRGKQLIVVGDNKQMPPSNFFKTNDSSDEYEEDDSDTDGYESILDLCSACFTSKSLLCHYRSRYESLISFSNYHFYNGDLCTYPSVCEEKKDCGVDFIYVPEGRFSSKEGINILEAKAVAKLVFEHFKNYPNRSLGVVAFNIKQQNAILKILDKMRSENPLYEEYFNSDIKEPFFVKNLETVQGDERDTIIFSITYGKNQSGEFAMRFGPLGNKGGERRLNVAVTRAKFNLKVVSSIKDFDIDISRISNEGPKLLHHYLAYAEKGISSLISEIDVKNINRFDSPFEEDVYNFLKEKGYDLTTQVGTSNYRIDLGLKKPGTSNYVLAIECDGATYHSSKAARDRDRLRQSILERMGWKFYRIWSTDWFINNKLEKEKLLKICDEALKDNFSDTEEKIIVPELSTKNYYEVDNSENSILDQYKICHTLDRLDWRHAAEDLIKIEGPFSINFLVKKLCKQMGFERLCKSAVDLFKTTFFSYRVREINGYLYYENQTNYYMRANIIENIKDIDDVSPLEIRNGMYVYIKNQHYTDKNNLFEYIKKSIGFSKNGYKLSEKMEESFKMLKEYIDIDKTEKITLKSEKELKLEHRYKS